MKNKGENVMTPLEALEDVRSCLQAYFTMEYVPKLDDSLKIIEKALEEYEELTRKKFIDALLSPTIKDFNYKPPKVDEIVISIDRKKIEEKYPSLRGNFDFSDLLHKVIEGYEKHRKI